MSEEAKTNKLSDQQKAIAFHEATEAPFSHPLNSEKRAGVYNCAVCGEPLFSSEDKYDSGSGWPSFTRPMEAGALGEKTDHKMLMPRTEVHCAKCGAHMGHVFGDGPPDRGGQRFCINGTVLDFKPGDDDAK